MPEVVVSGMSLVEPMTTIGTEGAAIVATKEQDTPVMSSAMELSQLLCDDEGQSEWEEEEEEWGVRVGQEEGMGRRSKRMGLKGEGPRESLSGGRRRTRKPAELFNDNASVCSRIFRYAIGRVLGLKDAAKLSDEDVARLPRHVTALLVKAVEAEYVVIENNGTATAPPPPSAAASGIAPPPVSTTGGAPPPPAAPAAAATSHSRKKKHGRRVSFNTYDLTAVDTPDLRTKGSARPMEEVMASLLSLLNRAKRLRKVISREDEETGPQAAGVDKDPSPSPSPFPTDAAPNTSTSQPKPAQQHRATTEQLVEALHELKRLSASSPSAQTHDALRALGSEPNWNEVANASGFYATEVSRLCLGAEEDVSRSRLLARFFESLSSLVRFEMKQELNLCNCQELDAGPAIRLAIMQARGKGDEGAMEDAVPPCCPALGIYAESTSLLQYNSDDPAALVHYALEKMASYQEYWNQLIHHLGTLPGDSMDVAPPEDADTTPTPGAPEASADSDLPAWWTLATEHADDILAYLAAVCFLLHFVRLPVIFAAAKSGRLNHLERLASLLHGFHTLPTPSEHMSPLRCLGDFEKLEQELDDITQLVDQLREKLLATTPEVIREAVVLEDSGTLTARRKRKRELNSLPSGVRLLVSWGATEEIPEEMVYPALSSACLYSMLPQFLSTVAAGEADGDDDPDMEGEDDGAVEGDDEDDYVPDEDDDEDEIILKPRRR